MLAVRVEVPELPLVTVTELAVMEKVAGVTGALTITVAVPEAAL